MCGGLRARPIDVNILAHDGLDFNLPIRNIPTFTSPFPCRQWESPVQINSETIHIFSTFASRGACPTNSRDSQHFCDSSPFCTRTVSGAALPGFRQTRSRARWDFTAPDLMARAARDLKGPVSAQAMAPNIGISAGV